MSVLAKFKPGNFDWVLFVSVFLLTAIGMAAIYSVDLSQGSELVFFKKQSVAFIIGIVLLFFSGFFHYTFFKNYAKPIYFFSVILLVAVLFFGKSVRGTTGWFDLGGFSFQPVELAKVGIILMLSYITVNFGRRFEKPTFFFGTMAVVALMIFLILLQPDLGSAFLLGAIWFIFMWLIGARKLYLSLLVLIMILAGVFSWFFLFADYQKDRVLTFVDSSRDALDSGYNVIQSTIAIGSGKLFGRGLGFGSQSQLRFLPEAQTDFIFSVIGEELGFAGVALLLGLFIIILWRLLVIVKNSDDDFTSSVTSCIIILFFVQFFVNIGASIGLLPVTGVPLPFLSYGGSSLIINLWLVGIAESMGRKKY
jgi:rod shape determining protein RodA